jgi:hypothetical protein
MSIGGNARKIGHLVVAASAIGHGSSYAQDDDLSDDDGSYDWFVSTGIGRFSGDYDLPDDTAIDVLNFEGRRYFPRGEVRVSVPYVRVEGPADVRFVGGQAVGLPLQLVAEGTRRETGLGDIVLRGDYYLHRGTSSSPWVIGVLRIKLPTGDEGKGLSTGEIDVEAGISYIRRVGNINWLADFGYTVVGSMPDYALDDVIRIGGGLAVPFGPDEDRSFYAYLENRSHLVGGFEDRRSLATGVEVPLDDAGRLRMTGSVFVGLTDTAEDYGVYVTFGQRY